MIPETISYKFTNIMVSSIAMVELSIIAKNEYLAENVKNGRIPTPRFRAILKFSINLDSPLHSVLINFSKLTGPIA